ncbi:hypothetical protein ACROYT_G014491 [Oculina patagonica]
MKRRTPSQNLLYLPLLKFYCMGYKNDVQSKQFVDVGTQAQRDTFDAIHAPGNRFDVGTQVLRATFDAICAPGNHFAFGTSRFLQRNHDFQCMETQKKGIACTFYGEIRPFMIHSLSGIGHYRGTKEQLLRNVLANQECINRWRLTEILFIDEISMLKKIHLKLLTILRKTFIIPIICLGFASGGIWSLPVIASSANAMDEMKYAFQSESWQFVFLHQVILEDSFCAKDDNELVNLLKDISVGRCSDQSLNIIKTLSRPLDPAKLKLDFIPKVLPHNEDVDFSNMCTLGSLPGQEVLFQAYDIEEKKLLNRELVANEKLILKVGAKVMFIYNINDRIKIGVQGTVASFLMDCQWSLQAMEQRVLWLKG